MVADNAALNTVSIASKQGEKPKTAYGGTDQKNYREGENVNGRKQLQPVQKKADNGAKSPEKYGRETCP
jgi:hypothetical protein